MWLKRVRDWLLLPVFLFLALALPEEEREGLRAEREMIESAARHDRRSD